MLRLSDSPLQGVYVLQTMFKAIRCMFETLDSSVSKTPESSLSDAGGVQSLTPYETTSSVRNKFPVRTKLFRGSRLKFFGWPSFPRSVATSPRSMFPWWPNFILPLGSQLRPAQKWSDLSVCECALRFLLRYTSRC